MAISSPGIGSGLDVNSIVSQLVELERKPLQLIQSKANSYQTVISAFGRVKSGMSTLQDAANALLSSSLWSSKTFSSSDSAVLALGSGSYGAVTIPIRLAYSFYPDWFRKQSLERLDD